MTPEEPRLATRLATRLGALLAASPAHRDALQALALAGPRGGWLGAGFLRNAVWDQLAGRRPEVRGLADLDVVHLTAGTPDRAALEQADARSEAALRAVRPALPWSVVDQARLPPASGPWEGIGAALAAWPETATAVAARLAGGKLELLAPHGLEDLFAGIVRPTPAHAADPRAVRARLAAKGWLLRWPGLRVIGLDPG